MRRAYYLLTIAIPALFLAPLRAHATTEFFFDAPASIRMGTTVRVMLRATVTESINAIEGTIRYDPAHTKVIAIDDADSAMRMWVVAPSTAVPGMIHFAAIAPGGTGVPSGGSMPVCALLVEPIQNTKQRFWLEGISAYLNRAMPHPDAVSGQSIAIAVSTDAVASPTPSVNVFTNQAPEFTMDTTRTPFLLDGAYVLVFQVHGGQCSPYTYRVRERFLGFGGQWRDATSPYRLEDQRETSMIELEARNCSGAMFVHRTIPTRLLVIWCLLFGSMVGLASIVVRICTEGRKKH